MTFPREYIERTISTIVAHELLEVVCEHTGRSWQAMSPEERESVVNGYQRNVERSTRALAEVARHAYEAGMTTAHRGMAPRPKPVSGDSAKVMDASAEMAAGAQHDEPAGEL